MPTTQSKKLVTTTIDISEAKRGPLCELLNARLADLIDLALQSKQAHWNVKGPHFIGLHKLFDELRAVIDEYVDMVAERCVILGGTALGTVQTVNRDTTVSAYPTDIHSCKDHVEALTKRMAEVAKQVREAIATSEDDFEDKDTADLFTEVSRGIDKYRWFVEAHLQASE